MAIQDDIAIYGAFRRSSRDEVIIWILFLCVAVTSVLISIIFRDTLFAFGSSIVLGGVLFSFVFDSFVAVRAKENLSLALSRLASIVFEVQEGIVIYDSEFRITVMNKQAKNFLGVRTDDIVGKPCRIGSPEATLYPRLSSVLFPSLAPAAVLRSEPGAFPTITDITFPDTRETFRVYTNRLTDKAGSDLGFIKVIYDRTEDETVLAGKSEFITVAAHQLRTPLTAINWALESLARDELLSPQSKSFVEAASVTARKLSETVGDLLEVARIESGKTEYAREPVDLREVIGDVLRDEAMLAKERGVTLAESLPKAPVAIVGDRGKLKLALSDLLENSIRYNKPKGSVRVSLAANGARAIISIEDTGIGIPKEDMQKLFTKFFRAANVMRQETEGTGLGLFIAKNIIDAHGGTIHASSELGEGTTFTITLPLQS